MAENINKGKIQNEKNNSTLKETKKQCEQIRVCIWNISSGIKMGTGFLSKILYNDEYIPILMTNYHILNDEFINNNKQIKLSINKKEKPFIIDINEKNKIYSSSVEKFDIMILKIKDVQIPNWKHNLKNNDLSFFEEEFKNLFDNCNKNILFDTSTNISKMKESILSLVLNGFTKDIKNIITWDQEFKNLINEKFKIIFNIFIEPILLNNKLENNLNLYSIIDKYLGTGNIFYNFLCVYPRKKNLLLNLENNKKYILIIERLFDIFREEKLEILIHLIDLIKMEVEIQVYIRTRAGKHYYIKIFKSDTIQTLKEKFEKETKIPIEFQILIYCGRLLKDENLVNDYITKNNERIHLFQEYYPSNQDIKTIINKEEKNWVIYALELLYKLSVKDKFILKALIQEDMINTFLSMLNNCISPIKDIIYNILSLMIKNLVYYNKNNFDLNENEQNGKIHLSKFEVKYNQKDEKILTMMFEEKPDLFKLFITILLIRDYNSNIIIIKEIINNLFIKYQNVYEKIYQLIDLISSLILINDKNSLRRYIELLGYPTLYISPIPKENKENQKWPLFGERLINGDINQEIYEYIIPDHNKNYLCLLAILFPSKYHPEIKIKIKGEEKKKILLKFIKYIYGDKNNYSLFKYLYTMPSRTLKYLNLYDEIITYLDIYNIPDSPINPDIIKNKEIKYKTQVEKELKFNIKNAKEKDINDINENKNIEFNYENLDIKLFNGFIAQIIPGEIIREEIYGISKHSNRAAYRIQYYTKYYKLNDLREKLLNNQKFQEKEEIEGVSEQEIKSELEELPNIVKYDISEMNENSIIYNIYDNTTKNFIIEDKTRKNENNVKKTLIRYIFINKDKKGKNFNAKISINKNTNYLYHLNQVILNSFFPNMVNDHDTGDDIKSFLSLQRLSDDLDFINDLIFIEILFEK